MAHATGPDTALTPALTERVLERLGLRASPALDLAGLSRLYAAYSAHVPFDNVQKRIVFGRDQQAPFPIGEPADFFAQWLEHGTGGTCWPINGALCTLLETVGFHSRRITASIRVPVFPPEWLPSNHGSVIVTLDNDDYLVDGWTAAYEPLLLRRDEATSTSQPLHRIAAQPLDDAFEITVMPSHSRDPVTVLTEPERGTQTHGDFQALYERTRDLAFFNHTLYAVRRFPDRIVTVGRENVVRVNSMNEIMRTPVTDDERRRVLVDELGYSEEIVAMLPPDSREAAAAL